MIWTEQGLDALRLFEGLVQAMEGMLNQPAMAPVPILKVPMQGTDMLTGAKPSGQISASSSTSSEGFHGLVFCMFAVCGQAHVPSVIPCLQRPGSSMEEVSIPKTDP